MTIPLPNDIVNIQEGETPNLSLKYYKWTDVYEDNESFKNLFKINSDKKTIFIKSFVNLSNNNAYNDAFIIRKKHLEGIGITFTMTTSTRLVFGMGYQHPTEIGFMFDWTTSLPIIPGSSLKGVARYAAEICQHGFMVDEIFGSEKGKAQAGEIIFFPAYPCLKDGQKFLEMDVMTPHYAPYYEDKNVNPYPADWYSPKPLQFITVPAEVKYCFRLASRKNLMDKESTLLNNAKNILVYALAEFGAGAKTSVSYGYFK